MLRSLLNFRSVRGAAIILVAGGALAVFLASTTGVARAGAAPNRPNLVLFLADDLGWADVTWHDGRGRTPHLDRLAARGVRLEAHYVHPMCSPTRAALMTGRYASRFGVTAAQNQRALPWDTATLARTLQSAGYATALVGKWHLGSKPEQGPQRFGFDFGYGSLAGGCGPYNHRYKQGEFTHTWHRNGRLVDDEGHVTDLIAREAVRWLEERSGEPFFLYVPFTAIHVPIDEPERWKDMNGHLSDPAERLRSACESHLDDVVGQVLETLERKNLAENTLVLFLSDNGAHAPSPNQGGPYPGDYGPLRVGNDNRPLRGHKSSVYEGGIRTPAVAYWPGKLAPGTVDAALAIVDWMPTLCALAGAEIDSSFEPDGQDVWSVLTGESASPPPRTIYSAAPGFRARMIRHGDWKLVVTESKKSKDKPVNASDEIELFDLANDLGETKNLALAKPDVVRDMLDRLATVSERDKESVATD